MNIAYNIDCMEYMKSLPDKFFSLAVVDPPYGDGLGGTHLTFGIRKSSSNYATRMEHVRRQVRQVQKSSGREYAEKHGGGKAVTRAGNGWNKKYGKKIIAWDVAPGKEYFDEIFRVSRNQIIWGGNYFGLPPTRCFLVWRKTNIPLEGFSMSPCEYAWTSFNENCRVFEYTSCRNGTSGKFHPTEKPIALYEWIYKHYAAEGDNILDTHLGSGSSRIAAYDMGLDFVGCEIDKEYFERQEERFAKHTSQMNLFLEEQT